jgi:hypothetical protein
MTLRDFAAQYRLRVNDSRLARKHRVRMGEDVVLGRFGEISEIGDVFRVRFLGTPRDGVMTGTLRNRYREAEAAGLVCKWKAEAESIFLFDPNNAEQVALVVRLVGARYRRAPRPVTPELLERLRRARESHSPQKSVGESGVLETTLAD